MKMFVSKYKKELFLAFIFSFACYGFMLTHFSVGVDEETWILSDKPSALWLNQGRFVIWIFNAIFTNYGSYAPFLWDFLSVILWVCSGILFAYALFDGREMKKGVIFFFLAYYSSVPFVLGDSLSFSMMNLPVCIAMMAAAGAFLFSLRFLDTGMKKYLAAAFLLLLYAIGTYQAFICVYVTIVAAFCLIGCVEKRGQNLKRTIFICAGICILAAVLYYLINFLIGLAVNKTGQGYFSDNYIGWTEGDWIRTAFMAVANIARISFAIPYHGHEIYGGSVIRCITIFFVVYAIGLFIKRRGLKEKLMVFFYTVAICAAPFILYVVLGTYQTHGRMLLGLPLAGAAEIYLIYMALNRKVLMRLGAVIIAYLLFLNARNMNLIFYYEDMVYEKDCTIVAQVMYDVQKTGADYQQKPIAFIGMVEKDELPVKELGILGGSLFAWGNGDISSMKNLIRSRGYAVQMPDSEQIGRALAATADMNMWPMEESIRELEDVIVVYFSEPTEQWYQTNGVAR